MAEQEHFRDLAHPVRKPEADLLKFPVQAKRVNTGVHHAVIKIGPLRTSGTADSEVLAFIATMLDFNIPGSTGLPPAAGAVASTIAVVRRPSDRPAVRPWRW